MNQEYIPTLTHATERDIDLLLVEELYACPEFATWMAQQVGFEQPVRHSTVLHSKRRTRSRREIDIYCELDFNDGSRGAILVENKLDALEQPDQAESYREELNIIADEFPSRAMLLVCPEAYRHTHLAFAAKFDAVVPYESLATYFMHRESEHGSESRRYQFRRELIEQAISKARRGYEPVPNEAIGDFNALYCQALERIAPEIIPGPSMRKPANPDESVSMIYDAGTSLVEIPAEIRPRRFAHELGKGQTHRANYVAVTFANWGPALSALRGMFEADASELGATFSTKPPSKRTPRPSLVMSCPTIPADNQSEFAAQSQILEAGMLEAARLRHWLIDNQSLLWKWQAAVEKELSK